MRLDLRRSFLAHGIRENPSRTYTHCWLGQNTLRGERRRKSVGWRTAKKSYAVDAFHRYGRSFDDPLGYCGPGSTFHALPRQGGALFDADALGELVQADLFYIVRESHWNDL